MLFLIQQEYAVVRERGNTMRLTICKNYDDVRRIMAERVLTLLEKKPDLVFCLPAGNSPVGMYKELVKAYKEGKADFSSLQTFDMDEYVGLGPEDPQSFIHFMHHHFLDHVNINLDNVRYPDAMAVDLDTELRQYAKEIAHKGLDIAITGIGDDGHIAFNEPGAVQYPETHKVKLDEATRLQNAPAFGNDPEAVPEYAITTGMAEHMKTKNYFVVCSGSRKAPLLQRFFSREELDPQFPVSWLRMHPNVEFIVDEEAAALIPDDIRKKALAGEEL